MMAGCKSKACHGEFQGQIHVPCFVQLVNVCSIGLCDYDA